jgi:hypothetical protein
MCCTSDIHARVHRQKNGHGRLDDGCSYGMLCRNCKKQTPPNVYQLLTIAFMLELVIGAKEFKLGFSGMKLTPAEMAGNIQVSSTHSSFWVQLISPADPRCCRCLQDDGNTHQVVNSHDIPETL